MTGLGLRALAILGAVLIAGAGCGAVSSLGADGGAGAGGAGAGGAGAGGAGSGGAGTDGGGAGTAGGAGTTAGQGADAAAGAPGSDAGVADVAAEAAVDAPADTSSFEVALDAPVELPAPSCVPAASGTRFVDHAQGHDDATHGGGVGACAYKTLTYALAHAPDEISLAEDTYKGGVAGEELPFLLTGQQSLKCNGASLQNEANMGTYDGIVQFAGKRNSVTDCRFDGGHWGGYCLVVNASAADAAKPHAVTQSTFTKCDNVTLVVPDGFNGLVISKNTFQLNFASIYFKGTHTGISVVDNTFVGNNSDVMCDTASPGITGSGNVRGGGAITCSTCGNCPF